MNVGLTVCYQLPDYAHGALDDAITKIVGTRYHSTVNGPFSNEDDTTIVWRELQYDMHPLQAQAAQARMKRFLPHIEVKIWDPIPWYGKSSVPKGPGAREELTAPSKPDGSP